MTVAETIAALQSLPQDWTMYFDQVDEQGRVIGQIEAQQLYVIDETEVCLGIIGEY